MKLPDYVKDYSRLFDWTDFWGEPIPKKYKYAAVDWDGLLYVYENVPTLLSDGYWKSFQCAHMYIGVVQYSGNHKDTFKIRENYSSEIYEIEKCIDTEYYIQILERQGYVVSLPRNN